MMRAWESRPDCSVVDEPFYACYLKETGADHPMREQILASQSTSREAVAKRLSAAAMTDLQYEKHMTHHMPRGIDLLWTKGYQARVFNSFTRTRYCFLPRKNAVGIA
jgi:hypothetical protein